MGEEDRGRRHAERRACGLEVWTRAFAVRAESMHTLGAVTEFAAAFLAFLARFLARLAAARSSISAPAAPVWTFAWTITTTSVGLGGDST